MQENNCSVRLEDAASITGQSTSAYRKRLTLACVIWAAADMASGTALWTEPVLRGKARGHWGAVSEYRFCICSSQELNYVTSKGLCFALIGEALQKQLKAPMFCSSFHEEKVVFLVVFSVMMNTAQGWELWLSCRKGDLGSNGHGLLKDCWALTF